MKTIEELRKQINGITTILEIADILSAYPVKDSSYKQSISIVRVAGYVIGWSKDGRTIYVTSQGEVILYETTDGSISEQAKNFILDTIIGLNNSDDFYKYYFRRYGYDTADTESETVREALNFFESNRAIINHLFINDDYHSITLTGRKISNLSELEYRIANCDKQDILDIVEITHITPAINKRNTFDYENPYYNRPYTSSRDILDSYNEYKNCQGYDD